MPGGRSALSALDTRLSQSAGRRPDATAIVPGVGDSEHHPCCSGTRGIYQAGLRGGLRRQRLPGGARAGGMDADFGAATKRVTVLNGAGPQGGGPNSIASLMATNGIDPPDSAPPLGATFRNV
ncbi:hypothetical protein GCM10027615_60100 [Plantactinospora veratri]